MRLCRCVTLLFLSTSGVLDAQDIDRKKLIGKIRFPQASIKLGISALTTPGSVLEQTLKNAEFPEITEIRKELGDKSTDVDRVIALAEHLNEQGERQLAEVAWERAARQLQQVINSNPKDAVRHRQLGGVLHSLKLFEQGEKCLRAAVRIDPTDWQNWIALGECHDGHVMRLLQSDPANPSTRKSMQREDLLNLSLQGKLDIDIARKADRLMKDSDAAFDQAIKRASKKAEPYFARGLHRFFHNAAADAVRFRLGTPAPLVKRKISADCLADFLMAETLDSSQARYVHWALFSTLMSYVEEKSVPIQPFSGDLRKALPPELLRDAERRIRRLEDLPRSENKRNAAEALSALAFFRLLLLDESNFEKEAKEIRALYRGVVDANPRRDEAWDALAIFSMDDPKKAIAVCEERLRKNKTAHAHFFFAGIYRELEDIRNAAVQTGAAARLEPGNVQYRMTHLVALVKSEPPEWKEIDREVKQIDKLLRKDPPREHAREYWVTLAAAHALLGDLDAGRQLLRESQFLVSPPADEYAREIQKLLPP